MAEFSLKDTLIGGGILFGIGVFIKKVKGKKQVEVDSQDWGGDPDGQLAKALAKVREESKKPREPLKIERLDAEKESKSDCPPATKDVAINTKNRNATIKNYGYGPLNVEEPADFWKDIAKQWKTTEKAAKKSKCGNCVAFDRSPRMKDCMPGETSDGEGVLGYCWMHHFKCHSARTCDTWAKGGPITTDKVSEGWGERAFPKMEMKGGGHMDFGSETFNAIEVAESFNAKDSGFNPVVLCKTCDYETTIMDWPRGKNKYTCNCEKMGDIVVICKTCNKETTYNSYKYGYCGCSRSKNAESFNAEQRLPNLTQKQKEAIERFAWYYHAKVNGIRNRWVNEEDYDELMDSGLTQKVGSARFLGEVSRPTIKALLNKGVIEALKTNLWNYDGRIRKSTAEQLNENPNLVSKVKWIRFTLTPLGVQVIKRMSDLNGDNPLSAESDEKREVQKYRIGDMKVREYDDGTLERYEAQRIQYDYMVHREPRGTEVDDDGNRIPNPRGGRFTSADAESFSAFDPKDPHDKNRYSYERTNAMELRIVNESVANKSYRNGGLMCGVCSSLKIMPKSNGESPTTFYCGGCVGLTNKVIGTDIGGLTSLEASKKIGKLRSKIISDQFAPPCPCGCDGKIEYHDDRGYGCWECARCGEDSDADMGEDCSYCVKMLDMEDNPQNYPSYQAESFEAPSCNCERFDRSAWDSNRCATCGEMRKGHYGAETFEADFDWDEPAYAIDWRGDGNNNGLIYGIEYEDISTDNDWFATKDERDEALHGFLRGFDGWDAETLGADEDCESCGESFEKGYTERCKNCDECEDCCKDNGETCSNPACELEECEEDVYWYEGDKPYCYNCGLVFKKAKYSAESKLCESCNQIGNKFYGNTCSKCVYGDQEWCSNCGGMDCKKMPDGDWYCMNFLNNRETFESETVAFESFAGRWNVGQTKEIEGVQLRKVSNARGSGNRRIGAGFIMEYEGHVGEIVANDEAGYMGQKPSFYVMEGGTLGRRGTRRGRYDGISAKDQRECLIRWKHKVGGGTLVIRRPFKKARAIRTSRGFRPYSGVYKPITGFVSKAYTFRRKSDGRTVMGKKPRQNEAWLGIRYDAETLGAEEVNGGYNDCCSSENIVVHHRGGANYHDDDKELSYYPAECSVCGVEYDAGLSMYGNSSSIQDLEVSALGAETFSAETFLANEMPFKSFWLVAKKGSKSFSAGQVGELRVYENGERTIVLDNNLIIPFYNQDLAYTYLNEHFMVYPKKGTADKGMLMRAEGDHDDHDHEDIDELIEKINRVTDFAITFIHDGGFGGEPKGIIIDEELGLKTEIVNYVEGSIDLRLVRDLETNELVSVRFALTGDPDETPILYLPLPERLTTVPEEERSVKES